MEFKFIMRNLPVAVTEEDIEDMFAVADTDQDGKISYKVSYYRRVSSLFKAWISLAWNLTRLSMNFQLH